MKPLILYNNLLIDATLDCPQTASGYNVLSLTDYRTHTFWKGSTTSTVQIGVTFPSAKTIDTIAVQGHNFGSTGKTFKLKVGTNTLAQKTPTDDNAFMLHINAVSVNSCTIEITSGSAAPEMAVCFLGSALEFDSYPATPVVPYSQVVKVEDNESKAGYLLGSTLEEQEFMTNHLFTECSRTWLNSYYLPFFNNHGRKRLPFFYAWDIVNAPEDVFYYWFPKGFAHQHSLSTLTKVEQLTLNMQGVR